MTQHRHYGVDWACGEKCPICWYQDKVASLEKEIVRLREEVDRQTASIAWLLQEADPAAKPEEGAS